jgi:V/A-type H+-transporting ATPase subunit I
MVEISIEQSLGELREEMVSLREELIGVEKDLRFYSNGMEILQKGLIDILNDHHLRAAKHDASIVLNDQLFLVEAWVPQTHVQQLNQLVARFHVSSEPIAIEPNEKIPTYMANRGFSKVGEDIVHIYDIPASTDQDPSLWVLCFFALFFAIIIADAGYGLIYFLLGCFLKWKGDQKDPLLRRFTKLVFVLSTSCILWGVATASFFGLEIGPDNPLRKTSFIHALAIKKVEYNVGLNSEDYQTWLHEYPEAKTATDGHDFFLKAYKVREGKVEYDLQQTIHDEILLELSLFLGILHITLSFCRHLLRNFAGLGWILFMVGGYLYFMGVISETLASSLGLQLLFIGPAVVFVVSIFQGKKWMAFHEVTNGIQVFSDILSYLRLYALGLAGMMMAETFNQMAYTAGWIGGFFILLIGHSINLTLSIMAGVIHGLRLNFLEWYRYSFEGEGRLFVPLRLRKVK